MQDNIKVSVLCLVYNHAKVLGKCLNGFVSQKVNFKFEVLIHDDASTDESPQIIKEYESKYPDIIKPIYQKENQYQQGIGITETFQLPRAKGKYYAMCEGDDIWTDENKLQKQFDFMEKNQDVVMCVHKACQINMENGKKRILPSKPRESRMLTSDEVIINGGGYYPTCSMFFRSEIKRLPNFGDIKTAVDFRLLMSAVIAGKVYFMKDVMAIKTYLLPASWAARSRDDRESYYNHMRITNEWLKKIDIYTKGKFTDAIQMKILKFEFTIKRDKGECSNLLSTYYHPYFRTLSTKDKVVIILKAKAPKLVLLLKKILVTFDKR